ncbi:MAG: rod shape-determining protein MreD [Flavobacteriales bacterium]|nr:rod shape-determining protein MreD [Flavobacteriales bacterium]
MIGIVVRNIVRVLFFVLLQALVVNRLDLLQGKALPLVYIFALLMIPMKTPRWLFLIIGFATGLLMDAFTNTMGIHASACTLLGFLIPLARRTLAPRDGYEVEESPTVQDLGLGWYISYAGLLTLAHHIWLFFLEAWKFSIFWNTSLKIILSAAATLLLMVLGQYLIFKPENRRR